MKKQKKGLPKELTTVTTLSKYMALLLFIALPIIAFQFGRTIQLKQDMLKIAEIVAENQMNLNKLYKR